MKNTVLVESYFFHCRIKKLNPNLSTSVEHFFSELCKDDEGIYFIAKDYEKEFDPRFNFNSLFCPYFLSKFGYEFPVYALWILSQKEDISLTDRKEALNEIKPIFFQKHIKGNARNVDVVAFILYLNEALRVKELSGLDDFVDGIFGHKVKNPYLAKFFKVYIKILSNQPMDPLNDICLEDYGNSPALYHILKVIYALSESNLSEAETLLFDLKHASKELYYLFGYGYCSINIDMSKLPNLKALRQIGQAAEDEQEEFYNKNNRVLTLFFKNSLDYLFLRYYEYQKLFGEQTTELLEYYMQLTSTQEKLLCIVLMMLGLDKLRYNAKTLVCSVSEVQKFINNFGDSEIKNKEDGDMLLIADSIHNDKIDLISTLEDLRGHGLIDGDIELDGIFNISDDLLIFTNIFSQSFFQFVRENGGIDEDDNFEVSAVKRVDESDNKDHES